MELIRCEAHTKVRVDKEVDALENPLRDGNEKGAVPKRQGKSGEEW